MSTFPSEAQFIYYGMTKEKWKFLTVEQIQYYLDEPENMDYLSNDFVECFHSYYSWYWSQQL